MTSADPLTLWTGWDLGGGASAPTDGATLFGNSPETAGEVRYELLAVAARGFRPPQFLTVLDLAVHVEGDAHEAEAAASVGDLRQVWSLVYRQVAETLGIPEGTAKSRLRLALRRIAEALESERGEW